MTHEEYLTEISKKIIEILGLNFQLSQFVDLERRMISAAKDLKINTDIKAISEWLLNTKLSNNEINILSAHLTINETYFFREEPALELFTQKLIPELITERKGKNEKLRIWSAGCSSGEEAYTLGIIIKEKFPELSNWDVTILPTDISPVAIQKALLGEFTEWSFRETPDYIKSKYFTLSGKNYSISPEIKKMITFSYLNLSKNSYPSSATNTEEMDIIFCRNVMMYFTPQIITEVSNRFYSSLIENGWLITSQVELNDEYFSIFKRVQYNKGIFYQKSNIIKDTVKQLFTKQTEASQNKKLKPLEKKKEDKNPLKVANEKKIIPKIKANEEIPAQPIDIEILFKKGQYVNCIEACLKLIETEKLDVKIFTFLIKSYANSGNLKSGEKQIKKLLADNSATPEMYYLYASFLNEHNETQESELILKKAIYQNHKHVLSHLMLGEIYVKNGKKHLAVKHYKSVIELLDNLNPIDIVPESEGLTAGSIKVLAESLIKNL